MDSKSVGVGPEMLEALEVSRNVLAKQLRFSAPERFETEAQVREHVAIKQMDQAIEKARGEK